MAHSHVNRVFVDGSTIYAATSNAGGTGGVSISTDGGVTRKNYTTANGLGDNDVRAPLVR